MDRYVRQTMLPYMEVSGQKLLASAKVLIVGAGGLGVPVYTYLLAAGIGTIGIIDGDVVEISNLPRQPIYKESDIGRSKIDILKEYAALTSSHTKVCVYNTFYDIRNAETITSEYDVVIDCTDNLRTRLLINDICFFLGKPLVYGGVFQMNIQLATFNYQMSNEIYSGNFRDLFPEGSQECTACDEGGVLGMVTGMLGNMQALEAIKIILRKKDVLANKVLIINTENFTQKILIYKMGMDVLSNDKNVTEICASDFLSLNKKNIISIDIRAKADEITQYCEALFFPEGIYAQVPKVDNKTAIVVYCQKGLKSTFFARELCKSFPDIKIQVVKGGVEAIRSIL